MAYKDCRFCGGRGCIACPGEEAKAAKKAQEYLDAHKVATVSYSDLENPEIVAALKHSMGREFIEATRSDPQKLEKLTAETSAMIRRIRSNTKFATFDIEIAKEIPESCADWREFAPLGISCAAIYTSDGGPWSYAPAVGPDGRYNERMSRDECEHLLNGLESLARNGYTIVTWNGLGFDFQVLADECAQGMADEERREILRRVSRLAWNHCDPGFHMVCAKGFMIGLQAAADGLGVQGKTEGMHGDLAPVLWRQGREQQDAVISYVQQDVIATANVFRALLIREELPWISKKGHQNYWHYDVLLKVGDANRLPRPDTSWMSDPRPPESFYEWVDKEAIEL